MREHKLIFSVKCIHFIFVDLSFIYENKKDIDYRWINEGISRYTFRYCYEIDTFFSIRKWDVVLGYHQSPEIYHQHYMETAL